MSERAKALVGKTVQLAGKSATVTEWQESNPEYRLQIEGINTEDEKSPEGWLKVCLETANKGSGQWWRYGLLSRTIDK